jgi:hypothetical protein
MKEDVSSYWMIVRKREDNGNLKRENSTARCGELALEEAKDML